MKVSVTGLSGNLKDLTVASLEAHIAKKDTPKFANHPLELQVKDVKGNVFAVARGQFKKNTITAHLRVDEFEKVELSAADLLKENKELLEKSGVEFKNGSWYGFKGDSYRAAKLIQVEEIAKILGIEPEEAPEEKED